jgi:hypothetical protein
MKKNALLISLLLMLGLSRPAICQDSDRQAEVARLGAQVMPFALEKTLHQFTKTATGGIQKVIVRNTDDQDQILLIRGHLQALAQKFNHHDFSGPEAIHGPDMPGLAVMKHATHGQLHISYADDPAGGALFFVSAHPRTIQAIHDWFDAQVSDHGHDAMHMHHHAAAE